MALVTTFMSGCYVDGTVEVFAVYDDVTNELVEMVVKGDSGREVDVIVNGETMEVGKHTPGELKFNQRSRKIRFFVPAGDEAAISGDVPRVVCTYYAEALTRTDIIADKLAELEQK